VWRSTGRGWAARITEAGALVGAMGFTWLLFNWNLLRFDLRF
jgi:hypothetical protein